MQPLLPDRHPNQDFFICDVLDAVPKDDMASMEHPVFSLSTRPDKHIRKYEHNGASIEIIPSELGLATIHDKDILIYCISQLVAKMNEGITPQKTLLFKAHNLLVSSNRCVDGRGYKLLKDALTRLRGTTIVTNIKTGSEEISEGFGLIDSWRTIKHTPTGRMSEIKIELSDWMLNAVMGKEVLTLHRDYFRLRRPLDKRIYELARKHCGQQKKWSIALTTLQKKCGSMGNDREFRRMVKRLVDDDYLPDYRLVLEGHMAVFHNRDSLPSIAFKPENPQVGILSPKTYREARYFLLSGEDVYAVEDEWREWMKTQDTPIVTSPDEAFIGFCIKRNPQLQQAEG